MNEDSEKRLKLWETKDAVPVSCMQKIYCQVCMTKIHISQQNTEHLQWLTKENEQLKAEVQRLTLLSQVHKHIS